MPLSEFLLKHTNSRELCVITIGGWINATFFIDHEDLFARYIHKDLEKATVKFHHWDTLSIVDSQNNSIEVPAHFIEIKR